MNKRVLLSGAALVIIVVSIALTLLVVRFPESSEDVFNPGNSRRYDVFEGYSLCEKAVKTSVAGQVLSLDPDDRAAKYDRSSNTNMLYFVVRYKKKMGFFGGLAAEEKVFIRCDVSARSNEVVAIRVRPAEEEHYTEVHRKDELP